MKPDPGRELRRPVPHAEIEAAARAVAEGALTRFRALPFPERRAAAKRAGVRPPGPTAPAVPPPVPAADVVCWAPPCSRTDTRPYLSGPACPDHTPAKLRERPEPGRARYRLRPLHAPA